MITLINEFNNRDYVRLLLRALDLRAVTMVTVMFVHIVVVPPTAAPPVTVLDFAKVYLLSPLW